MTSPTSPIVEDARGVVVVTPTQPTLDAETAPAFREEMERHSVPHARVLLDLRNVEFIDSAGLGAVLAAYRGLAAKEGRLVLCELSAPVRGLFEMVRLHRVLDLRSSRDDALGAFSS